MTEEEKNNLAQPPEGSPEHFSGKDALGHVAEAQARGLVAAAEEHGTEPPGFLSAGADAARDTAIALLLLTHLLSVLDISKTYLLKGILVFAASWLIWKLGRAAWLGWAQLERLHRVLEQERWEIQHHRQQERIELKALYAAKGFQGQLLEDVLDVLMADGDRLLRVMVEEELGLSLEVHEHPLKQGLGAALGVAIATAVFFPSAFFLGWVGALTAAFIIISCASALTASYAGNRLIPAIIWNIGLTILTFSTIFFLFR